MSDQRLEVHPVPQGSIIVLRNVDMDPTDFEEFMEHLPERLGHSMFVVVRLYGDATMETLRPDEVALLLEKLRPA